MPEVLSLEEIDQRIKNALRDTAAKEIVSEKINAAQKLAILKFLWIIVGGAIAIGGVGIYFAVIERAEDIADETAKDTASNLKATEVGKYLMAKPEFLQKLTSVPSGAVLAFDGSCPSEGWQPYKLAAGRFIIAANGSDFKVGDTDGTFSYTIDQTHMPSHSHLVWRSEADPQAGELSEFRNDGSYNRNTTANGYFAARDGFVTDPISGDIIERPKGWQSGTIVNPSSPNTAEIGKGMSLVNHVNRGESEPFEVIPSYLALNFCKKD